MRFRCKMCDLFSIQYFYRVLQTIAKLAETTCIIRITPTKFYIFSKTSVIGGGWHIFAEIQPDILFDEFQMSGLSPEANEIYVEVSPTVLLRGLKVPQANAQDVKLKLVSRAGPCMCIEANLPSQAGRPRQTVFDVPVIVVPRQLWSDITPSDEIPFNIGYYITALKIFKGVIDRMRSLGQSYVEISANQSKEMKIRVGGPTDGYNIITKFAELEPTRADGGSNTIDDDEQEQEIQASNGWFSVVVDLRRLSGFLGALQISVNKIRIDIRHRRYLQMSCGIEDNLRLRFVLPALDQ